MNPKLHEVVFAFMFGILLTIASGLMQAYSKRLRNSKIAYYTYQIGSGMTGLPLITGGTLWIITKISQNLAPIFLKMELPWAVGISFLGGPIIFISIIFCMICITFLPTFLVKKLIQRKSPEIEFPPPSANEETGKRKAIKELMERVRKM